MNSDPKKEINIFDTTEQLAEFLGNIWQQGTNALASNTYYTIALSGGNTPIKIFQYMAENFRSKIDWTRLKFFWGDERCVPPEDIESNYRLAKDNLFSKLNLRNENIFRIHGESDPKKEVIRYSKILNKELLTTYDLPKFDFVLLGMGEDGHTASIFPHQIKLFYSKKYCEVAHHPISNQNRITITGSIINNANIIVIAAVGRSKAEKVTEVIKGANQYPVSLVSPSHGKLIWLLDHESASLL